MQSLLIRGNSNCEGKWVKVSKYQNEGTILTWIFNENLKSASEKIDVVKYNHSASREHLTDSSSSPTQIKQEQYPSVHAFTQCCKKYPKYYTY